MENLHENNEGGCLCGALRFAVNADPVRVTVCHCTFCQRATGAEYHVAFVFQESDFEFTKGSPRTYAHVSDGSGKKIFIRFCPDCGTKICLTLERFTGTVGVYGGTFDNPNYFARRFPISKQIFLRSGRHGSIVPANTESFWEHAVDEDDQFLEGEVFSEPCILGQPG